MPSIGWINGQPLVSFSFKPLQSGALVPRTKTPRAHVHPGKFYTPSERGIGAKQSTPTAATVLPPVLNPFRAGHWCQAPGFTLTSDRRYEF